MAQSPGPQEQKHTAEKKEEKIRDSSSITVTGPPTQINYKSKAKSTQDQAQDWHEWFWPPIWSNWALVVAAIIAARAAFRTLGEIRRQSKHIRRQVDLLVFSDRSWVIVANVRPPNFRAEAIGQWGLTNSFECDFVNKGKTIARLTGPYKARFHPVPTFESLPATPEYKLDPIFGTSREAPMHGTVLAPGDSTGRIVFGCFEPQITPELWEDMQGGKTLLYFYASITYFDFSDQERELQFCYVLIPGIDESQLPQEWNLAGPKGYNKHT